MIGDPAWAPAEVEATLEGECGNSTERTVFVRAVLTWGDGDVRARPLEGQGSGTLRSLGEANGFIILPPGAIRRGKGARVRVQVLPGAFGEIRGGAR
jgi:molybdopterin biosynthesis enzyme